MKRLSMTSAVALATVVLASSPAFAARYMVVFKDKDVYQQTHVQLMLQQAPLASIRVRQGGQVKQPFAQAKVEVQDSLQNLNTLVIDTDDARAVEALEKSGVVAFVEKEVFHPAPKPVQGFTRTRPWDYHLDYAVARFSAQNDQLGRRTPWGIHTVKAPGAWTASNYGEGSRVLILDTGIDRDHPALKDNYEKGQDFVGDNNSPYAEADKVGHGTHVAGTVGALFGTEGFVGVAPKAKMLMGRVCSELGCSNIAVTTGINWGIQEKVDIISMSLGGPFATLAERRAVEAAEAAGVVVVAASGNDGQPRVSYPAAFPTAIAVGAMNEKVEKADFSNWGPELDVMAPGVAVVSAVPVGTGRESTVKAGIAGQEVDVKSTGFAGAPDVLVPLTNSLVFAGLGKPEDFTGVNVTGKFALISRGEINFADKVKNAIAAGAAGVVIFNNAPGLIQGSLTQDGSVVAIPVVMIEQTTGEELKTALAEGQTVNAVIQTSVTDYSPFDGTSMATPHVAGIVALMKAANRNATPARIREVLKATAIPMGPNDQNQTAAGLVDAEAAVRAIAQ